MGSSFLNKIFKTAKNVIYDIAANDVVDDHFRPGSGGGGGLL